MANKINHPKKQFCPYGHDTFICGRAPKGQCRKCQAEYAKKRREEHREEILERRRQHYRMNTEKCLKQSKIWREAHKQEMREYNRIYTSERLATDVNFKLKMTIRNRIKKALNKNYKSGSAVKDLGCSIEVLKQYIESMFYDGMTWNNWGTVWELDHIMPLWKFDLTKKNQFLQAVNYKNLQPLTKEDHQKKSVKELKEFHALKAHANV